MKIAVLLTSFNRKSYTLKTISLVKNLDFDKIKFEIYLTDDNSSDGTSQAVKELHPDVKLLKGNGSLFWAGGMRKSWKEALKKSFDGYLLLNDDTFIYGMLPKFINEGVEFCKKKYSKQGILVGSTETEKKNEVSYGGNIYLNLFKGTYKRLKPKDKFQECDLCNANILFVHSNVVSKIGILSEKYEHGVADFDYSYRAKKAKIPVLVMPNFQGFCINDSIDKEKKLLNLKSVKERYNFLISPLGFAFKDNFRFQMKFFPYRLLFVLPATLLKLFIPKLYIKINSTYRK